MMADSKAVLVVDDSMVMRSMIRGILAQNGFIIVAEAKDGQDAVTQYLEHHPDLVTMDLVMPRELGIEAVKRIMKLDPDARIIVVSGLNQKTILMQALDAGARDYVIKPFDEQELVETAVKRAR
jgi:two-component system, chemotaxis family, chemotaxis protein CheY